MTRTHLPTTAEIENLLRQVQPHSIAPLPPATLRDLLYIGGFARVTTTLAAAATLTGLFALSILPPSALAVVFAEPGRDAIAREDRASPASLNQASSPTHHVCAVALSDLMQTVERVERFEMRRSISDIPIVASSQMIPETPRAIKRHRARRAVPAKQTPASAVNTPPAFLEKLIGLVLPRNSEPNGG